MPKAEETSKKYFSAASSVGSERELDNLNDLNSLTSSDFRSMSWPGDTRDGELNNNEGQLPLRPGSGIPPHHRRAGQEKPRKRVGKPSSVTWSIDVSEGRQSPDSDRWTKHVDPLPEPQTDVPVFSVASGERLSHFDNATFSTRSTNLSDAESYNEEHTSSGKRRSKKRRRSSKDPKKKKHLSTHSSGAENGQVMSPAALYSLELAQKYPSQIASDSIAETVLENKASVSKSEPIPSSPTTGIPAPAIISLASAVKNEDGLLDIEADFLRNRKESVTSGQSLEQSRGLVASGTSELEDSFNDIPLMKRPQSRVGMKKHDSKLMIQSETAAFISSTIFQRECNRFVWDRKTNSDKCFCGRDKVWHQQRAIPVPDKTVLPKEAKAEIWHPKTHTFTEPCDSFGEIHFRGFGSSTPNSPYARIDYKTRPDLIWELLIDYWKMPKPRLLISVTGGAQRFELKPRLSSLLKQGLIGAAVNTGAWIITGGTATGVMEFVGEAVRDHITVSGRGREECVALGVATWGCVANKLVLDGEDDEGLWPVTYAIEDVMNPPRGSSALDRNHTHFLLVDNGTDGQYGAEIKFRSELESYISKVGTTGVSESQVISVPVVLIVVEGGVGTMETVFESLNRHTPVVVINGSGRAADYISLAYNLTRNPANEDSSRMPHDFDSVMHLAAERMFTWKENDTGKEKKLQSCIYFLKQCLKRRNLINVYDLEKSDSVKDIDRALLFALLKANKSKCKSQLALALAWNRCDIARQQIFTRENRSRWEIKDLYDAMFTALVQDRADFVELFLDNGVDLRKFLTVRTLWNLYCNCLGDATDAEASILRHLITYCQQGWGQYLRCKALEDWKDYPKSSLLLLLNKVIVHLLRDECFNFYSDHERFWISEDEKPTMGWKGDMATIQPLLERMSSLGKPTAEQVRALEPDHDPDEEDVQGVANYPGAFRSRSRRHKQKLKENFDFEHPERDLFIFAIMFNRRKMAHLFLNLGVDQIGTALLGCSLLKALSDKADMDEEVSISVNLSQHAQMLETFAISVLSECYTRTKCDTHLLLTRELKQLGHMTVLNLVERQELMEFAEHSACQTKLSDIWKGSLTTHTSEGKILITILLPFLIFLIKFKSSRNCTSEYWGSVSDQEMVVTDNNLEPVDPDGQATTSPRFARSKTRRVDSTKKSNYSEVRLFDCGRNNGIHLLKAIHKFYKAPVTKFYTNIVAYLIFLGLFSFFLLTNLRPTSEPDSPSTEEIVVWVWFVTLMIEENRQVLIGDQRSLTYKIRNWWTDYWNRFDFIMYLLVVVSVVLRYNLSSSSFVWVRIIYSITLAMSYLRCMQFFYAEKNMGPKVIMIRRMLTDLMFFFLILLVFVLSFGVAYHANMFPNAPLDWSVFFNVLYYPYFQIYGELFIEDLRGDDSNGCTRNETIWRKDPMKRCGDETAIVPILLAVYMILTNVLLVNLLIAMFSYTFQTVQDNSTKVWRFYRIALVYEYFDRPSLVPPIIIINHIFRLFRFLVYYKGGGSKRKNAFRSRLSDEDNLRLTLLEKACTEVYLAHSSLRLREQMDQKVSSTADRLEVVMTDLQRIKEAVEVQEQLRLASIPDSRSGAMTPVLKKDDLRRLDSQMTMSSAAWSTPRDQDVSSMQTQLRELQDQASQNTIRLTQLTFLLERIVSEQKPGSLLQQRSVEGDTDADVGGRTKL
ncbi:transient receptor potential cation channel subfamily M member-like 2 [Aplysia californica]|uniref:Transient receptor potential cation channel subfamily M member-like 2 n=1 Tax=Aplysia californica TaxID=6500 RepID=A0ABM0JEM3_APLCA|nr:transient receptor potential cation channel subfamily M member-like 2 [Aplysia californica]